MIDRGNKKWTSIVPPELVDALQQIEEEEKNIEKPILSEDQLEDMQRTLDEALEYSLNVSVEYYKNKRIHTAVGRIKPPKNGKIEVMTDEDILFINTDDIVGASLG